MKTLISGSVAIDTLLRSPFAFSLDAVQIQSQRLAVSYYMPEMQQVWGGCAANIAYALRQLGGAPVIMATVGDDAAPYLTRFAELGMNTDFIKPVAGTFTAKAVIMSDTLGQQITGFHPGAMDHAHTQSAQAVLSQHPIDWAIVSPDGKAAMLARSRELAAARVRFIADPGQAMPIMSADDLAVLTAGAALLAVNEHEAALLEAAMGQTVEQMSQNLPVLVTLGNNGLVLWQNGQPTRVAAVQGIVAVDPTGCGDSLRGAMLFALSKGLGLLDAVKLGNLMGAHKVQFAGGQGYQVSLVDLRRLWDLHETGAFPL